MTSHNRDYSQEDADSVQTKFSTFVSGLSDGERAALHTLVNRDAQGDDVQGYFFNAGLLGGPHVLTSDLGPKQDDPSPGGGD